MIYILLTTIIPAIILAYILTPLSIKLAPLIGATDKPNARKSHTKLMPRMGGAAIAGSFFLTLLTLHFSSPNYLSQTTLMLLIGGVSVFFLGLSDDIWELSPKIKFIVQFIIAGILVHQGVFFPRLINPFTNEILLSGFPLQILSFFWIVGITNAINLIDGLDGLAAGISTIILSTLSVIAYVSGNTETLFLTLPLLGAIWGFIPYNFNPAKTFMGDGGSLFLGYWVAVLSITNNAGSSTAVSMLIPIIALGFPIFDTLFAVARRVLFRKRPFAPDKEHVHHRILALGFTHKQTVFILYGFTVALCLIATLVMVASQRYLAGLLILVGLIAYRAVRRLGYFANIIQFRHDLQTRHQRQLYLKENHFKGKTQIRDILFQRWLLPSLDLFLFCISWLSTCYLFDIQFSVLKNLPLLLVFHSLFCLFSFRYWRCYQPLWRYIRISNVIRFCKAPFIATTLIWIFSPLLSGEPFLNFRFFVVYNLIFTAFILILRFSHNYYLNLVKKEIASLKTGPRVMIYGAGDTGEIVHNFLIKNDDFNYSIVGFIDDDLRKKDNTITEYKIHGSLDNIKSIYEQTPFDILVLATRSMSSEKKKHIQELSKKYGFQFSWLESKMSQVT